ncbi:MAG: NgoFVII family restriction endonuclease [Candidatus Aminicenantes bacterium]|nr:NgoFVII family restriction endonuclease [Candidatus Aminicenantes bacterium]
MPIMYKPVVPAESGPYRGTALVGTHSAVIGWTLDNEDRLEGLLGFAIRRTDMDPETGEVMRLDWLGGYKRFAETDDGRAGNVRSLEAPFQRFRWNDYTLKPTRTYRYEVFPMRGRPGALTRDQDPLVFELCPSLEDPGDLGVFVNRGVTAAMAYLDRFSNRPPSEVGAPAYDWLSRGLKESLLNFIAKAEQGDTLHVAIYEFFDYEVAQAFKDVLNRDVKLQIVHDANPDKHSTEKNEEVIHHFQLEEKRVKRNTVNISHNKIVIRLKNGIPHEVWTGSANFSENAFNFQTNTALIVHDPDAVQHFEDYFQALAGNPSKADSKVNNRRIMDRANAMAERFAEKTFFSPIKNKEILETSVKLITSAKKIVMVSAPFGVDKTMIDALLDNSDDIIEYGLVNATAKKKIEALRRRNTRFFIPKKLKTYLGRNWDAKAFGAHKIHAKTIVVDPWGDNPKVLIGSANFSEASCSDNDENVMLITGDKRLSSIIATEFMRMYDHYKSRYYIDLFNEKNKAIKKENRERAEQGLDPLPLKTMDVYLKPDNSWSKTAFNPDSWSHKYRDRIVFSGG